MKDIGEFPVGQKLKHIRELVIHVLAQTLGSWLPGLVEEASEEPKPEAPYSFCVPRYQFLVVLVKCVLHFRVHNSRTESSLYNLIGKIGRKQKARKEFHFQL